jgi:DNA (cytosine-5)-methyltransferase 3A
MDVVSLFDGIGCAHQALRRAGIDINSYTACEIDKYASQISKRHFPSMVQMGNVKDFKTAIPCDLLIGGSPCTDLSIAKKGREGLKGVHSSLFYEYVRIKNLLNPKWFILENVFSMKPADRDTITSILGVEPIMIDAALVSAQRRRRYFWTNIPTTLPDDKGICLKDVLQSPDVVSEKYYINKPIEEIHGRGQARRVHSTDAKSVCLSACGGGWGGRTGLYTIVSMIGRRVDAEGKRCDDDETVDYAQRLATKRDQDKSGTLTGVQKDNLLLCERRVRRLTPIECERLQGLPDNYTDGISDTQRYKCCGNAFNVDVVAHILKGISAHDVITHV